MKDSSLRVMRGWVHALVILGALWCATDPGAAWAGEKFQLHGYGSWSYRRTANAGYIFDNGTHEGNYTNVSATLNVAAQPTENLLAVIQANWQLQEARTLDTVLLPLPPGPFTLPGQYGAIPIGTVTTTPKSTVELDYAFAEWAFSDAIRFRAGQVKLPFGLYTEIWDVGTLRPFLTLPKSIYGGQAIVAEAYQGGGFTGNFDLGDWGLLYDLYGGQVTSEFELLPTWIVDSTLSDVLGGRVVLITPTEGLSFGFSGYFGLRSDSALLFLERGSVGFHLDYSGESFLARFEVVFSKVPSFINAITGYGELAYMIDEHIQVAARVDFYKGEGKIALIKASTPETTDEHADYAVGLNYWFSPNFVIKTGYHYVRGNRFSVPTAFATNFVTPYAGLPFDDSNHLFEAGAQFSF